MDVPASVTKIKPLPPMAITILDHLPSVATAGAIHFKFILEQDPVLLDEVAQIIVRHEENGERLDPREVISQVPSVELARMSLTFVIRDYLRSALQVSEHRRYWRYTMACAVASGEMAEQDIATLAYAGGLLHDIGRLALIVAFPDKYANMLALTDRMFANNESFDLLEHERTLFGLDRFETANVLSSVWKLPTWLLPIVGKFKPSTPVGARDLVSSVRSGCRVAHALGFGYLRIPAGSGATDIGNEIPQNARRRWSNISALRLHIERGVSRFPM